MRKSGSSVGGYRRFSKYKAKRTTVDGETYDSKAESIRGQQLKLMERTGLISNLKRQVRFIIAVNGHKICTYIADFTYTENGIEVTEDVKGYPTPEYRLKKKLMLAVHGVEIRETGRK